MKETKTGFKNLFSIISETKLDKKHLVLLKHAEVTGVNVYKKSGRLEVTITSDRLIPAQVICNIEKHIKDSMGLNSFSLKVRYNISIPFEKALYEYRDSIIFFVNKKVASSRGIFSECGWELKGNVLSVRLDTKGCEILKSQGCHILIENIIEDFFERKVKVDFIEPEADEELWDDYIEFKETEEAKAILDIEEVENSNGQAKNGKAGKNRTADSNGICRIIIGKDFTDDVIEMKEVNEYSGKVAIKGDIFAADFREIRGGRYLCTFDVTDYTSSITVKFFIKNGDSKLRKEQIREGITVKIQGEAQYDRFSHEPVIMASDIIEIEKQVRQDSADKKRVELHLHTQMSSMDAVTPVKELVKRAAQWGHEAIAITDHGVIQSYPDAYETAKKYGIKIIYGVECYLVDDGAPIVINPNGYPVDGEFIALDIETTGLYAGKDEITEIGAVKIKSGAITKTFSRLVNPGIPIPQNISKLTGITGDMVEDEDKIELVLPQLLEFIGDLPLIIHNAPFDMGFIEYKAEKMGLCLNNPVIDTLQYSRRLFPRLGKHRLDSVAKYLGIKQQSHHRAADDAETAGRIFFKCLEAMGNEDVKTIDDIGEVIGKSDDFKRLDSYHAVILAKNRVGLKSLYKIISDSHLKYYYKKPRVPKSLLLKCRKGLLVGSACEAGELYTALVEKKSDKTINNIVEFYDYLEIQPLCNNQFLINNGKIGSREDLIGINRKIVELGMKFNKPVAATCDVHFMDPRDEAFRRILMAGQGYEDADNQAPLFLRTTGEMLEEFSYLGSEKAYEVVVANTNRIAGQIEVIAPVPEGAFPPKMEGAEEKIKILVENKAREIYGDPLPEIVENRLKKEMDSIIKNGFAVMYLIAQKLVAKSLSEGYLVGSRGSVGSSFVANMAGITEVNSLKPHYICKKCRYSEFIIDGSVECGFDLPDKKCPKCGEMLNKDGYDIPFETFLGFEGDKEPDIDLNFSGEYQPRAHKYVEELFGETHVFRAGTIATVAEKTAYGFVKNYMDERNIVVTNAEINRLVKGCTGIKRTTGQHPGGIMVVPQDKEIFDFSPIQHPADDTQSGVITTHFDYNFLCGSILKLDILGHDDPTVIKMLEDLTGVDVRSIVIGEKRTMGIFSSTEPLGLKPEEIDSEVGTFGIPEFGTRFVRQMLVDTKPTTFSELIRISGLSHGTDVWLNNAQELIKNDTATLSEAICCRDDIMLYLIQKGLPPVTAFKIMEDVRKGRGLEESYEEIMKRNSVPDWYIQSCKKIKYMFPKAHAAAYVMMAFRIAWFKVYYPEAFYIAYFTVRADVFDAELMTHGQDKVKNEILELKKKGNDLTQKEKNVLTILEVVNEMYARGMKFLPVDLYKSDPVKFKKGKGGIRPPLNTLQGLGATAAQNIAEARSEGAFLSVEDLIVRSRISKTVVDILQRNGCLEGMPESNQISLF